MIIGVKADQKRDNDEAKYQPVEAYPRWVAFMAK
jgi:hypothetical protein